MQKKSLPKTIKKSSAKPRGKTRQSSKKNANNAELNDFEAGYIDIYKKDPEREKKLQLLWLITIPAAIALIIFWFWLLQHNLANQKQNGDTRDLRDDITKAMNDIKNNINLSQAQNIVTTSSSTDINEVKNKIIEQLQKNLNPETWPSHDSEILAISIKYPPEWSQNEQKESITISAPSLSSSTSGSTVSTDNTYSRISIIRISVTTKTKLEDWLKKNAPSTDDFTLASNTKNSIDGRQATTYQQTNSGKNDINQIIYVQNGKYIYEIQVNVLGRKTLDNQYINGIINNIKFL